MGVSIRDRTAVFSAIDEVAQRMISMVQQAPDLVVRVPATPNWTVGQAFAHVVTVAPRYCQGPRQLGRWTEHAGELRDVNADELARLDTADITELAGRLRRNSGARRNARRVRQRPTDLPIPWRATDPRRRRRRHPAWRTRRTRTRHRTGSAHAMANRAKPCRTHPTGPHPCPCRVGSSSTTPSTTQRHMRCNYADKEHTALPSTTGR